MVIKLALAGDAKPACASCDGFEMGRSITPLKGPTGSKGGEGAFREYATAGQGDTAEKSNTKSLAQRTIHGRKKHTLTWV